ncbi:MAG: AmmeMemoRadiSam system protein B [Deltaproteobacteria bacterium]|jgi:poly-gamma-glutamate synthesis protein (capsule biosynthesis protein)|nr:AmmeMemoRadiSam system protein B [Deltaproteobacteria bacterium]
MTSAKPPGIGPDPVLVLVFASAVALLQLVSAVLDASADPVQTLRSGPFGFPGQAGEAGLPVLAGEAGPTGPFPPLYPDASLFEGTARLAAQRTRPTRKRVTGLVSPHHLLAADLIAQTFAYAADNSYGRIVILSPEHFRRGRTPVSVPERDFRTPAGTLVLDREAVRAVLSVPDASVSSLFSHEHGIQAVLPFIALRWPQTEILPVALRTWRDREGLDALARILIPMALGGALIVQSTDFSHYLTEAEADVRDLESRRVLTEMDPEKVFGLRQPDNVDSVAAMYLQMSVQRALGAEPRVIAVRNSCTYAPEGACRTIDRTTSYMAAAFELP